MGIRVDGIYGCTGNMKIIWERLFVGPVWSVKRHSAGFCALAFVGLAVVKAPEGLILGDVRVEELERVLRDEPV